MLSYIIAICAGILAASGLIISKVPSAKDLIEKIRPFQAILGIIVLIWGVREVLTAVDVITTVVNTYSILFATLVVVELIVGFTLSFPLLSEYVFSKNATAKKKTDALNAKLLNVQGIAGLILVGIAIFLLIIK